MLIDNLRSLLMVLIFISFFSTIIACGGGSTPGNDGQLQSFPIMPIEPEWIRNGEPIVFESEMWYPQDLVESLIDSEVYLLGEHRGVQFFVEKVDVRPYERIYTKFGRNRYRVFERQTVNLP